jgi:hypothetical protein
MKQFRNSGWALYDKVQAILPNVGEKGTNAYSALSSNPAPSLIDNQADDTAAAGEADDLDNIGLGGIGRMNVDSVRLAPGPGSNQSRRSNKRKASAVTDDDSELARAAHNSLFLTTPDASPTTTHRKRTRPSPSPLSSSYPASETAASGSRRQSSNSVALYGVQGSINHLADSLRVALTPNALDPASIEANKATLVLNKLETFAEADGISSSQMVSLIRHVTDTPSAATALDLILTSGKEAYRKEWLKATLDSLSA